MIYFIYKTTHLDGKYYVGRHSTSNINDGYLGSGKWPKSIKDKGMLTREILEYAETEGQLIDLERKYLKEHFGKSECMNMTMDPIGVTSENNPMYNPEVAAKISGNNHYMRSRPNARENSKNKQLERVRNGTHNLLGDNNPMKNQKNKKKVAERTRKRNLTNNASTINAANGTHHWQNGNSPNAGGILNKKLVEEGRHNFLGPAHNRRMIEEGKNPWAGATSNNKRLLAGTHPSQQKKTCQYCGKTVSSGMLSRWHGDNCKQAQ